MMAGKTKKHQQARAAQRAITPEPADNKRPFAEHFIELRRRLFFTAVSITVFSGAAYIIEHRLVDVLIKPSGGQQFIYTSPVGGVDFLFRLCLYVGIALSIPVIVYQILKYLEPLMRRESSKFIAYGTAVSGILAVAGVAFGYFVGLPNALHFLLHQFITDSVKPLVTIQSYMSFVGLYMLGSAMLFQVPLIMIFINRIKPLTPRKLLRGERWMILAAFIGAGLMNPSPHILDQLFIAGPLILMYQVGISLIWLINRKGTKPAFVMELIARDVEVQAQRWAHSQQVKPLLDARLPSRPQPRPTPAPPQQMFISDIS